MNILETIIEHKKKELEQSKKVLPLKRLIEVLKAGKPPRHGSFIAKMKKGFSVIAEVKKGSPSRGIIRKDFDPLKIAKLYEAAGADAMSILTDEKFFFGRLDYLAKISRFSKIPLLRKDFIIDEYQLYEARAAGADLVLLIASILPQAKLNKLMSIATRLGMETLCEVHDKRDLTKAIKAKAKIIGVNNRDLRTFTTNLKISLELKQLIPKNIFIVSESGISTPEDVLILKSAGFNAILVGESLMRQSNPARLLKSLKLKRSKR